MVLSARSTGPYEEAARSAWAVLAQWLEQRQAHQFVKQVYGVFRDNPRLTDQDLLRYDACVALPPGLGREPDGRVGRQMLPGGAYAVHTHVGSHGHIGSLFARMHRDEVPKRGLTVEHDRPFMAIYLNDPMRTAEAYRRSELCVPVLPVRMQLAGNDDEHGEAAILAGKAAG
jgi:AraC family transcriptional regulator